MSEPKTDQTFSRIQISIESLAILVFLTNKFLNCFSTKDVMKIGYEKLEIRAPCPLDRITKLTH